MAKYSKNKRGLRSWDPRSDRYWGWFTYNAAPGSYHPLGVVYGSGGAEEGMAVRSRNWLRVCVFRRTLFLTLPTWLSPLRPWRRWVTIHRDSMPAEGYVDTYEREYGFSLTTDGGAAMWSPWALHLYLGAQTHSSDTTQGWYWSVPWTDHRVVRHSYYDHAGNEIYREPNPRARWNTPEYDANQAAIESVPTLRFSFLDYDGESLTCTTRIEEMEWRKGTGRFKWVGRLYAPLVKRTLDLRFSGETGKRKGSWKGGTRGHAIEMLPGELHAAAFERYCAEHRMTYLGPI